MTERRWRAAKSDFFEFVKYIRVESKDDPRGWCELELFDYQVDDINAILNNKWVCILKARQLGITTITTAYALWLVMFKNGGARILITSKNEEAAAGNLEKIYYMHSYLPEWMQNRGPKLTGKAVTSGTWEFSDGTSSHVKSLGSTKNAGASMTADLVILDEFGLTEYQDEILKSVAPTTLAASKNPANKGAVLIMMSTARGGSNTFAQTCQRAAFGKSKYHFIFHPWTVSRLLSQADYDRELAEYKSEGKEYQIHSEYPATIEEAFSESGRKRFGDLPPVDEAGDFDHRGYFTTIRDASGTEFVQFVPSDDGKMYIRDGWLDPSQRNWYCMAIDPAEGKGLDYTVATIWTLLEDGTEYLVAYWRDNATETKYAATELYYASLYFAGGNEEHCLTAVETNFGAGGSFIMVMQELGHGNMYTYSTVLSRRRNLAPTWGFSMNKKVRPAAIDKLAATLPRLHPLPTVFRRELGAFVIKDDGRIAADVGCHDDTVMSMAIGIWVLHEHGVVPRDTISESTTYFDTGSSLAARIRRESEARLRDQKRNERKELRYIERHARQQARLLRRAGILRDRKL